MQKQNNKNLKNVEKKELDVLDRFLKILWRKEVEYKINMIKAYLKEISYETSNRILNYTFYFSLIICFWG